MFPVTVVEEPPFTLTKKVYWSFKPTTLSVKL